MSQFSTLSTMLTEIHYSPEESIDIIPQVTIITTECFISLLLDEVV